MRCEWKQVKLGDVATVKGGKRLPKNVNLINTPNTHPYIRVRDLNDRVTLELNDSFLYVDDETQKGISRYVVNSDDIVISIVGTIGLVAKIGKTLDGANLTENCVKITNLQNIDKEYLFYYLKSDFGQQEIMRGIVGAVQQKLPIKNIQEITIKCPELIEQKKIAAILSALDEKIAINREINDNLYHLLSLSFKNDYWDKAIDHPEWIMTTLDETTSRFGTGLNPRKNFVLGHGNNYYVTIKNMGNNRIYLDERCDKIDDEAIRKIQMRSDLKVGDLLFSGIGTIGRVFLIDKPATNWNTSESVFNLRPNAKVSSEFLYLLLLNNDMQDYAISLASGSVQKGIRMADLKKYSFFLPTSDVIKRLTSLWKPLIKQIKANEVESDSLAVLRDTLLPKLMSGEIDVSSVLL